MFAIMTPNAVGNALVNQYWSCEINGNPTVPIALEQYAVSATQKICSGEESAGTENTLTFLKSDGTNENDILFDYLEYILVSSPVLKNGSFIEVIANDTNIKYQGSWLVNTPSAENTAMVATGDNSPLTMEYTFNGTYLDHLQKIVTHKNDFSPGISITLLVQKYMAHNIPEKVANISFLIDKGTPTIIQLQPVNVSTTRPLNPIVSNEIIFQSPPLDPTTPHTLNVTYLKQSSEALPLMVQSLIVENGPSLSSRTTATSGRNGLRPVIAYVVVGSVLFLFIMGALISRAKSKKRRFRFVADMPIGFNPFASRPVPITQMLLDFPNASGVEIKTRRRLLLTNREALLIPPAKLSSNDTRDNASNETTLEHGSLTPPLQNTGNAVRTAAEVEFGPVSMHAVDSGLRQVEDDWESGVSMLPPVYTPA